MGFRQLEGLKPKCKINSAKIKIFPIQLIAASWNVSLNLLDILKYDTKIWGQGNYSVWYYNGRYTSLIIQLSKPIECTTLWVLMWTKALGWWCWVSARLWPVVTNIPHWCGMWMVGEAGVEGLGGNSLYFLLNFDINLKTALKITCIIFQ